MPDEHAVLSPSTSERWLSCPASVRVSAEIVDVESKYAEEGTRAHALAELRASLAFDLIDQYRYSIRWRTWQQETFGAGYTQRDINEMGEHADSYVELLKERFAEHPHSRVFLEQRVFTGLEGCWGTADCIIASPEHVEIVDFKYGKGVRVNAFKNSQLMLYGIGALEGYGDLLGDVTDVYCTVYQPRIDNVSTFHIPAEELRQWRDSIRPTAASALDGTGGFGPSEKACRWCPAAGSCRARIESLAASAFDDLEEHPEPDTIPPEELGTLLSRLPELKEWIAAVEHSALVRMYSGGERIPGWKVVRSGGRRIISDPELAQKRLIADGFKADDFMSPPKLLGVTALDTLVGGKRYLKEVLGPALTMTEGTESIAPESDPRAAISPKTEAVSVFDDLE